MAELQPVVGAQAAIRCLCCAIIPRLCAISQFPDNSALISSPAHHEKKAAGRDEHSAENVSVNLVEDSKTYWINCFLSGMLESQGRKIADHRRQGQSLEPSESPTDALVLSAIYSQICKVISIQSLH